MNSTVKSFIIKLFAVQMLMGLLLGFFQLSPSIIMAGLINKLSTNNELRDYGLSLFLLLCLNIFSTIFNANEQRINYNFDLKFRNLLLENDLKRLFKRDLIHARTIANEIHYEMPLDIITSISNNLFRSIGVFLFSIGTLLLIDIRYLILALSFAIMSIFLSKKIIHSKFILQKKLMEESVDKNYFEGILNSPLILREMTFHYSKEWLHSKILKASEPYYRYKLQYLSEDVKNSIFNDIIQKAPALIALIVSIYLHVKYNSPVGNIIIAYTSTSIAVTSIVPISNLYPEIIKYLKTLGDRAPSSEIDTSHNETESTIENLQSSISFLNLRFCYGEHFVLNDASFTLKSGILNVICGANGSGKSTLIKLLLGYEQFDSGRIMWDSIDISENRSKKINSKVSVLFQDFVKLRGTVSDNLGSHFSTDNEYCNALDALRFCDDLPAGLSTVISIDGFGNAREISGGQWQKVGLSRLLGKNASLYLMDEPETYLDRQTTENLQEAIYALLKAGKTVVIVSHQIETIVKSDWVIYLPGDGSVIEGEPGTIVPLLDGQMEAGSNST